MAKAIYLDYAAATPLDKRVLTAMGPYFSERFYNPSATYLAARSVRTAINEARSSLARQLGVRTAEVIFTAGATEANNLAIQGVMGQFPEGEVLVSSIEHESVLAPAGLFKNRQLPVDKQGLLSLPALEKMITDQTVLISIMLVNNELGGVQPLREAAALMRRIRQERLKSGVKTPLYLHTDAAQAANYFDLHASRLGVDLLSLNGGKIYGPKQSGALYIRTGVQLKPLIVGGGQERNLRSGTENVAGIVGLAKALDITQADKLAEAKRVRGLKNLLASQLANMSGVVINGSPKKSAPHILHLSLPGFDGERLMMELDEQGIQCAVGSACSAANTQPSHVLTAIGLPEDVARSSLRFSFGRPTSEADIYQTASALKGLIAS